MIWTVLSEVIVIWFDLISHYCVQVSGEVSTQYSLKVLIDPLDSSSVYNTRVDKLQLLLVECR